MKIFAFSLLFTLVVTVASQDTSESPSCPPSHPIEDPTEVHQHQIIACSNGNSADDKNSLIYQDIDGIWYNLKKKPLPVQPITTKPKRGHGRFTITDYRKYTGPKTINIRRGDKNDNSGGQSADTCPNGHPNPFRALKDGICYRFCWDGESNNPDFVIWNVGSEEWRPAQLEDFKNKFCKPKRQ